MLREEGRISYDYFVPNDWRMTCDTLTLHESHCTSHSSLFIYEIAIKI